MNQVEDFLTSHKIDILEEFKKRFFDLVSKGQNPIYKHLLKDTLKLFGIDQFYPLETCRLWFNNFHDWFNFVHQQAEQGLEELIVHDFDQATIWTRTNKRSEKLSLWDNQEDYITSLQLLAIEAKEDWNYLKPFISFNYNYKSFQYRITLCHQSLGPKGQYKVSIRKHSSDILPLKSFTRENDVEKYLQSFIQEKRNILIAGPTGSGKTTLMKSLLAHIDQQEHLIILEDTHEINITNKNWTFFKQRAEEDYALKDFCAYSLRFRPDRLILGEMRSEESIPFLMAMNTGHKGLCSTIHANNGLDAIHRVALLFSLYCPDGKLSYELVLKLVCQNLDYIIYMEKGEVKEIIKVHSCHGDTPYIESLYLENTIHTAC